MGTIGRWATAGRFCRLNPAFRGGCSWKRLQVAENAL
jgi:hypothetical protein